MTKSATAKTDQWVEQAACSGRNPRLFFADSGEVALLEAARRICATCPVQAQCLAAAIEHDERFGVWGGLDTRERDARQGRRQLTDRSGCGTYPKGYGRHRRAGEQPCAECRAAANEYARIRREQQAGGSR